MKKLKRCLRISLFILIASLCAARPSGAGLSSGGAFVLNKMFVGGSGAVQLQRTPFQLSGSAGEAASGHRSGNAVHDLISGYMAGYLGRGPGLRVVRTQVGSTSFYQDGVQIGVPLQATVEVVFSDQLNPATLNGIQVIHMLDHLGRLQSAPTAIDFTYEPSDTFLRITPRDRWQGNSLYEIRMTAELQSIDGFTPVQPIAVRFLTAVDPRQESRVSSPLTSSMMGALDAMILDPIEIHIPAHALPDYSLLMISRDPLQQPLSIDPAVIREANQKAAQGAGPAALPLAIREVNVLDLQGRRLEGLTKSVQLSLRVGENATPDPGLRREALSIWSLNEERRMWVKLPESEWDSPWLRAPVSRFAVFAVMAPALGKASETLVFPNPWRPWGPNAGDARGQTGTELGGITFSQIPSECTISIYTLNGKRVRELRHSDLSGALGLERWDGKNHAGQPVASGVYLWRVQSAQDRKTGKLMVIR